MSWGNNKSGFFFFQPTHSVTTKNTLCFRSIELSYSKEGIGFLEVYCPALWGKWRNTWHSQRSAICFAMLSTCTHTARCSAEKMSTSLSIHSEQRKPPKWGITLTPATPDMISFVWICDVNPLEISIFQHNLTDSYSTCIPDCYIMAVPVFLYCTRGVPNVMQSSDCECHRKSMHRVTLCPTATHSSLLTASWWNRKSSREVLNEALVFLSTHHAP